MNARRNNRRGSTVIEVMMAITVLAIGASGVVALQKVTSSANRNSRTIAVANEVARTWIERLRMDAMLWNYPSPTNPTSDLNVDTLWLKNHIKGPDPTKTDWFRPTNGNDICGTHDVFGRDEPCSGGATVQGPYCVNLRLSWVREDQRMIRAEVRVHWVGRNEGEGAVDQKDLPCGDPTTVDDLAAKGIFRVAHAVTMVTKNEAP